MDAGYGWDNEGRMTSLSYPCPGCTPATAAFTYDAMSNLTGLTDAANGATASATYGPAGEIDTLTYSDYPNPGYSEGFTYNNLWQLTRMTATSGSSTVLDQQYIFPTGQNNGRISRMIDNGVGETVDYTYDKLNRLSTAAATNGAWGQSYSYDGFGNLNAKTVTAGSAMHLSVSFDANNHQVGVNYDANGNALTTPDGYLANYDAENRLVGTNRTDQNGCGANYSYDPQGKRLLTETVCPVGNGQYSYGYALSFYGINGKILATGSATSSPNQAFQLTTVSPVPVDFGNIKYGGQVTDRLGTVRNGTMYSYFSVGRAAHQQHRARVHLHPRRLRTGLRRSTLLCEYVWQVFNA